MSGLVAVAKETAPRCKLCQNAHRPEIDDLLVLRSQRLAKTPDILAQLAEWGVENPTEDNLKAHFKRHVDVVTKEEAAELQEDIDALFEQHLGPGWQNREIKPDEHLSLLRSLSVRELYRRAKSGKELGVTPDHGIKATAESTKRKSSERTGELLGLLVAGTAKALSDRAALPPGELPEVVEDADYEEITDEESG